MANTVVTTEQLNRFEWNENQHWNQKQTCMMANLGITHAGNYMNDGVKQVSYKNI